MGGLGKNPNNLQFLKIKDGKFYLSTDKENTEPYDELTGVITDFRFKDEEFNNSKIRKLYINVRDENTTYSFSVSVDSSYMSTLVNFLKNADLYEPVTLIPSLKTGKNDKGEEVKRYAIFVKQDGTALKGYFSQETGNKLPEFKKVKVSGKTVWDKTEFLEALEDIVTKEFIPTVQRNKTQIYKERVVVDDATPDIVNVEELEEDNELPWEK